MTSHLSAQHPTTGDDAAGDHLCGLANTLSFTLDQFECKRIEGKIIIALKGR
jgi:hypothetical protein